MLLFACEIGQRFCNAFEEVDNVLGQINFYLLPIEIQCLLPTVILYFQEPLVVRFFGSLCCTREQFKEVGATIDKRKQFVAYFWNSRWWKLFTKTSWYFVNSTNERGSSTSNWNSCLFANICNSIFFRHKAQREYFSIWTWTRKYRGVEIILE